MLHTRNSKIKILVFYY